MASLDADVILRQLGTRRIGSRIVSLDSTESTNRDVLDRARDGEVEGTVVVADQQTAGRGRLNRSWESPAGKNLTFSVLLRPDLPPETLTLLPIAAGIAVCEVLRENGDVVCHLKWPNDVILDERKICGVLVESEIVGDRIAVALGIGVNVNASAADFGPEVSRSSTSLKAATGETFDRAMILTALLRRLETWYEKLVAGDGAAVVVRWGELSPSTLGHPVTAQTMDGEIRGKAVRLGKDGALVLSTEDGEVRITAGDVKHVARRP